MKSLAVALLMAALVAAPASAKTKKCGAYSKDDGSLASQVVTNIKVSGGSCSTGDTVAFGYQGQLGSFKASGYKCTAYQGSDGPPGSATCKKSDRKVTYTTGNMTSCDGSIPFVAGVYTYNTACPQAVALVTALQNASSGSSVSVMGFTCNTNTFADSTKLFPAASCAMASGETYDVVQVVYASM
jgi:hypothetical protein